MDDKLKELQQQIDEEAKLIDPKFISNEKKLLENQYLDEIEKDEKATFETTFQFAVVLKNSQEEKDLRRAITLFQGLLERIPGNRDCLYFLSFTLYRLGEYEQANKYIQLLSQIEPNTKQINSLKLLIQNKLAKEGAIGLAISSGIIAAVSIGAVLLVKAFKK